MFWAIFAPLFSGCDDDEPRQPRASNEEMQQRMERQAEREKLLKEKREAYDKKLRELEDFAPPVKLTDPAYLNQKGVVLGRDPHGVSIRYVATDFGQMQEAKEIEEIESVVKIICRKGARLGAYQVQFQKRPMPVFAVNCEVSVIDYKIPAIVGRKIFTNRNAPATLKNLPYGGWKEFILHAPTEEIKDYVKNLSQK